MKDWERGREKEKRKVADIRWMFSSLFVHEANPVPYVSVQLLWYKTNIYIYRDREEAPLNIRKRDREKRRREKKTINHIASVCIWTNYKLRDRICHVKNNWTRKKMATMPHINEWKWFLQISMASVLLSPLSAPRV